MLGVEESKGGDPGDSTGPQHGQGGQGMQRAMSADTEVAGMVAELRQRNDTEYAASTQQTPPSAATEEAGGPTPACDTPLANQLSLRAALSHSLERSRHSRYRHPAALRVRADG